MLVNLSAAKVHARFTGRAKSVPRPAVRALQERGIAPCLIIILGPLINAFRALDAGSGPRLRRPVRLRHRDDPDRRRPAPPDPVAGPGHRLRRRAGCLHPPPARPGVPRGAPGWELIAHNAAFDLKVTQAVVGDHRDVYAMVESNLVWDTMILHRLHSLATVGHTARGEAKLEDCARAHLGLGAAEGHSRRRGPRRPHRLRPLPGPYFDEIPEVYLRYAAGDRWRPGTLFWELHRLIKAILGPRPGSGATSATPGSATRSAASAR